MLRILVIGTHGCTDFGSHYDNDFKQIYRARVFLSSLWRHIMGITCLREFIGPTCKFTTRTCIYKWVYKKLGRT